MKKVFDITQISDPITLNIGGKVYSTSLATLTSVKGSYFDVMFNGSLTPKPMANTTNTYFIDRDGKHFRHILNMLRGKKTDIPREIYDDLQQELDFYSLKKLEPELSFESVIINKTHCLCDDQGATLTIVKSSNGNIFGGFASQPWNSKGAYYGDGNCWLYTLHNSSIPEPTKYLPKWNYVQQQAKGPNYFQYGHPSFGPSFGGGHDLCIGDQCNTNTTSYSSFPHTYNDTHGKGKNTFAGSSHFTVSEIEAGGFSGSSWTPKSNFSQKFGWALALDLKK
eukprot:gene9761-11398_t